ncbi:hypothetical protein AAK899_06715 [Erysipelotrichaceae bacterium 51-3]|uniref:hypothetical protein n=1 Tax=Allobaculum sp. JKK-2023 TaxID=3108943 RepID=UPI002B05824D|nr:hypothetical protein [Allobaculum sp. JKK-2023]
MILLPRICLDCMEHDVDSYQAAIAREVFRQKKKIVQFGERKFFEQCFCSKASFQRYLKKMNMDSFERFKRTVVKEMEEIEGLMRCRPRNQQLHERLSMAAQVNILAEPEAGFLFQVYLPYFLYLNPNTRLLLPVDQSPMHFQPEDVLIVASTERMLLDLIIFLNYEFGQKSVLGGDQLKPTVFIGPKGISSASDPQISIYIESTSRPSKRINSFCKAVESILF